MDWLFSFFENGWNYIVSLFNLLLSIIKGLFNLIKLLPTMYGTLADVINGIPSVIATFALISFTISVVFLILGRGKE